MAHITNETMPAAKAVARPTIDASVILAITVRQDQTLRLGIEHPFDRRHEGLGRQRPDHRFAYPGLVVADNGRWRAGNSCRCAVGNVLLHALDGLVLAHALG